MSSTATPLSQLAINRLNAVYFVNSDLADLATLLAGVPEGAEVVLLDPTQDGLSQMLTALNGRSELGAIHIIGHGASGLIDLGSTSVTAKTLTDRADDVATLGRALSSTGDILLYGCDVGEGVQGAAFIQQLAALSGADVAASTNRTGAAALGGDWVLEAHHGSIESTGLRVIDYSGVLAYTNVNFTTIGGETNGNASASDHGSSFVPANFRIYFIANGTYFKVFDADGAGASVIPGVSGGDGTLGWFGLQTFVKEYDFDIQKFSVYNAGGADEALTITGYAEGSADNPGANTIIQTVTASAVAGTWTTVELTGFAGISSLRIDAVAAGKALFFNQFYLQQSNTAPTLTVFSAAVATGNEDTSVPITLAALMAQGNTLDDGQVVAFVIKSVSTGTLKIGVDAATATDWAANTNDTVDATHIAYWTGAQDANGSINAFTAVAKDNVGAESSTARQVLITLANVNDVPTGSVTITGTATQGQTLTATNNLADVDGMPIAGAISYQWLTDGIAATGATADTYTLTQADVGKIITVTASYTDLLGTVESEVSTGTAAVANVNAAPTLSGVPVAAQAVTVGTLAALNDFTVVDSDGLAVPLNVTLTATNGTINGLTDADINTPGIQLAGTAAVLNSLLAVATFTATAAGAASMSISVSDGVVTVPVTATYNLTASVAQDNSGVVPPSITDTDGVSDAIENNIPGLVPVSGGTAIVGDGNGDGIADSQQSAVTSVPFLQTTTAKSSPGTAPPVYITLVAGSKDGKIDATAPHIAALSNVKQLDAPTNLPADIKLPLGLISFDSTVGLSGVAGVGVSETFSLYVDASLGANAYLKQNAAGTWVNVASAAYGGKVVTEGGKTRLDFAITDGGEFDSDGIVNGVIADPGGVGFIFAAAPTIPPVPSEPTAPSNTAPTITGVPSSIQGVTTGRAAALADFLVADVEQGLTGLRVTLTPSNGTINGLIDVDANTPGIQLTGTAATLNAAMAGATFTATAAGAASIVISVSDGVVSIPVTATYSLSATSFKDADHDQFPDALEAANGLTVGVKDNDVFTSSKLFALQMYRDILYREGEDAGVQYWQGRLDAGVSRAEVAISFLNSPEFQAGTGAIARLYFGSLSRLPDAPGMSYWMDQQQLGTPLSQIAAAFAASPEFTLKFAGLGNTAFIESQYQGVLGRSATAQEQTQWTTQLVAGASRGVVLLGLTESPEYKATSDFKLSVALDYLGLLGRPAEQAGFDYWVNQQSTGMPEVTVVGGFIASPEFHDRFLP